MDITPAFNPASDVALSARNDLARYVERFPLEAPLLEQARAQLLADGAAALVRSNMTGHITTSMLVVDPVTRKVLLVAHGIYLDWMPPGGHWEHGNSLWQSAVREVLEETGVDVKPLPWQGAGSDFLPIDVDTHPIPANPKKGEGDHFHHDFTFVGQASSEAPLRAQEEEVDGVKWVSFEELARSPLERVRRLGEKLALLNLP